MSYLNEKHLKKIINDVLDEREKIPESLKEIWKQREETRKSIEMGTFYVRHYPERKEHDGK